MHYLKAVEPHCWPCSECSSGSIESCQGAHDMTHIRTPHMTDYEAERAHFHLEVPEAFNFATDVIGTWASNPDKLAMLWVGQTGEERRITYAQFAQRSSRASNALLALGIQKGDRALVMLPRI